MKRLILMTGMLISCSFLYAQSLPDTTKADATITNATVYFGYGAELNHEAKVKVGPGTRIIVINQLSTSIDVNSLQVSCPEDVTLLSQRFNVFYPVVPVVIKSKEVERWEDSIEVLQKDISRIDNNIAIEKELLSRTGALIEAALSNNGNKAVVSAEVLRLVEFYNARIERSKSNIFNYQQSIRDQNKKIELLRKKITDANNLTLSPKSKPYGQIILQVMTTKTAEIPVSLSYYTHHAGWTPVYDIRVNSKTNRVKLVYKASLMQTTGIDWKKTKLTLSTGTPNFGVAAPVLSPWH
ncbi:MAG TPA: mucoidy inhibitor MuiA family protein, partial [Chitinophagaceae bacterium]